MTMLAPTLAAARCWPDAPAIVGDAGVVSFAELEARVTARAASLLGAGIQGGSRGLIVGLWGPNRLEWIVAALALMRVGAVVLPLSTRWTDAELGRALLAVGCACVLAPPEWLGRAAGLVPRALDWATYTAGPAGTVPTQLDPDAPSLMLLTSGTTGAPKAVVLAGRQLVASADAVAGVLGMGTGDRWWLGMPLFHVGGLGILLRCLRTGAALVLGAAPFEPARAHRELEAHGATLASCVPTMVSDLYGALPGGAWPAAVRAVMIGGAPVSRALAEADPRLLATYGLTEAASTVTLVRPGASLGDRLTAGRPLPGTLVRILGPDGEPVPAEVEGEVAVAGSTVMLGYHGRPDATAEALAGGWLHTGDLGRLDAAGRLTVLGRRNDLIVSGGENVYPAEVEAALLSHPGILEAAVVAMPDPRWGEVPLAFLVGPEALPPEVLGDWLSARLARFKQPRVYRWLPALPRLANGKPDRRALRDRALDGPHGVTVV